MNEPSVYIYKPQKSGDDRSVKRRRLEVADEDVSLSMQRKTFERLWAAKNDEINSQVQNENNELVEEIGTWILGCHSSRAIPAGLIVTSYSASSRGLLYQQVSERIKVSGHILVTLEPADCPNLKAFMKTLIQKATSLQGLDEADDDLINNSVVAGPRLLNYDLQILGDWCLAHRIRRVVVAFQDAEAFDANLISDAIHLFRSWSERIDFITLFGISTSVDLFQERLPQYTVQLMEGKLFSTTSFHILLNHAVRQVMSTTSKVWPGPNVLEMLSQRQIDCTQDLGAFIESARYAYMSHCYGNSASVFLDHRLACKNIPQQHFEALRNTPSFRRWTEDLLNKGNADMVRQLLDTDSYLLTETNNLLEHGRNTLRWILGAVEIFYGISVIISSSKTHDLGQLYSTAMRGQLKISPAMRELMLRIRRASAENHLKLQQLVLNCLMTMPPRDIDVSPDEFQEMFERLQTLVRASEASGRPLLGEHELRQETFRTTVVAQKVELSKQQLSISKEDSQFSELVSRFHDELVNFFDAALSDPKDIYFYEILVYDLRIPHRDAFTPKPRYAIERALSNPQDYLACQCCKHQDTVNPEQPPTAILYKLYLESGALINMADLHATFCTILDDRYDEQVKNALFTRAVAELKYMGFVKPSRKRVDHVARLAWKGL